MGKDKLKYRNFHLMISKTVAFALKKFTVMKTWKRAEVAAGDYKTQRDLQTNI